MRDARPSRRHLGGGSDAQGPAQDGRQWPVSGRPLRSPLELDHHHAYAARTAWGHPPPRTTLSAGARRRATNPSPHRRS